VRADVLQEVRDVHLADVVLYALTQGQLDVFITDVVSGLETVKYS